MLISNKYESIIVKSVYVDCLKMFHFKANSLKLRIYDYFDEVYIFEP